MYEGWFYKLALSDFEIVFEDKLKVVERERSGLRDRYDLQFEPKRSQKMTKR